VSGLRFAELIKKPSDSASHAENENEVISSLRNRLSRDLLQCTQYSGDVMFVPSLWGHATLNVRQSVGVAHEFSVEPFCME
jgi:oxalate decarboxylase/phosphoglucose isomerase-like protein (cupin superfamily)